MTGSMNADTRRRLLDDSVEVAVDQVQIACRDSAHHLRDAAERIEDAEVVRTFRDLADSRERAARRLIECVRRRGDLPKAPDPDRRTAAQVARWIHTTVSSHPTTVLLEERIDAEHDLEDAVGRALEERVTPETRTILAELARDVPGDISRLRALLATRSGD